MTVSRLELKRVCYELSRCFKIELVQSNSLRALLGFVYEFEAYVPTTNCCYFSLFLFLSLFRGFVSVQLTNKQFAVFTINLFYSIKSLLSIGVAAICCSCDA